MLYICPPLPHGAGRSCRRVGSGWELKQVNIAKLAVICESLQVQDP